MTVTKSRPIAIRVAAALLLLPLIAACGSSTASPTATDIPAPTPTPVPSYTVPSFSLAPAPVDCPTKAPDPMKAGTTATVTMKTAMGNIVIKVTADWGPHAAGAFVALAKCGYYNNVIFHRPVKGFILQAGDGQYARLPLSIDSATKMGQGTPGWTVTDDKVTQKYVRGMVALARGSAANSGGSQFFFVLADSANDTLGASSANNYAQFGQVTSGLDVMDKIADVPTRQMDPNDQNSTTALVPIPILGTDVTEP